MPPCQHCIVDSVDYIIYVRVVMIWVKAAILLGKLEIGEKENISTIRKRQLLRIVGRGSAQLFAKVEGLGNGL